MNDPARLITSIPLSSIIPSAASTPSATSMQKEEKEEIGSHPPIKRKRGRRSKEEGGRNWDPARRHKVVEWKPEYEYIVSLSIQGYTAPAIKVKVLQTLNIDYSTNYIYQILRTEQAVKLKKRAIKQMRQKLIDGFVEKEITIQNKVLDRLDAFVKNDDVFDQTPLAAFDRILKLRELHLKQTHKLDESANGGRGVNININNNQQVAQISTEDGKRLVDGLDKLKEIRLLHGAPPSDDGASDGGDKKE